MGLSPSPARALDFLDALDDDGARPTVTSRRHMALLARQVGAGPAITLRTDAGALAMIMGLWPAETHREAWFAPGPALRAELREVLRWSAFFLAGREPLVTYVAPHRVAVGRVARRCGFQARGEIETALGPLVEWRRDA